MKYTYLGRTGLKVSRLCLGTMNFGKITSEKDAFYIMDSALDAGINYFDTANVYGRPDKGLTEELIGRWFSQGGGRREKVVLATKVYHAMEDPTDIVNEPGLSAFKIIRHLNASLKRLDTDHVEIYQMHHVDRNAPWDELWGTYEILKQQGKIMYVGSSNFAGWHLVKAQAAAREKKILGLVSEQHKYSLLCRLPELEVLPAAKDQGIGVIPYSPLFEGLLGGNALSVEKGSRTGSEHTQKLVQKHEQQLRAFSALCAQIGEKEANVALAWLLANPAITAPIVGPRKISHLTDALRAVEIDLDADTMKKLDEIFPGPGGTAPEAYAW